MKLSQIEKRIPQTLTNSKDIIQTDREYARRSSRARSTRGQENEAWALYKKNPSRESWGDLSGERYIICPKPPYPAEKIPDRRQLFFLANHNSPEQTLYTPLNLNEVEQEVDDDWDTVSVNSRAKRPQMNGEAYITETNVKGMCTSKQRTSTINIFSD